VYQYKAKLVRVVDGDTVILDFDLGFHVRFEQRVRLARIDAIERKDDPERLATTAVINWFAGTNNEVFVKTTLDKTDKYGRVIGEITQTFVGKANMNDHSNLSDHQVVYGHAVYKSYGTV
jgi:micrococcal nuclease